MKTILFIIAFFWGGIPCLLGQGSPAQVKIHVLHFACSNPNDDACNLNNRTLEMYRDNLFKDLKTSQFLVIVKEFRGGDFSVNTLRKCLNTLKVDSNDVILFLFSGHGSNTDGTPTPTLNVSNNIVASPRDRINLQAIYTQLLTKNARLTLVIGNACNRVQQVVTNSSPNRSISRNKANLAPLFSSYKGGLLFWSAQKGQSAYGDVNEGNYFGESFMEALYQGKNWEQVVQLTRNRTSNLARTYGLSQKPMASLNVSSHSAIVSLVSKPSAPASAKAIAATADAKITSFLTPSVITTILQADQVNAYLLHSFKHDGQTFEGFRIKKQVNNLPISQVQTLQAIIANPASYSFDNMIKNCIFSPLVGVVFKKGNSTVRLLLCTDCDVWRFYSNNTHKEEDFDRSHVAVVKWMKTIFPNDPIIQKIH